MAGLLGYQLNPTATTGQFLGDALSGIGAGLLAYGSGGVARQQAGLLGLNALQQAPQIRQERLMNNLQYQLGSQALQQGGISNALNNAQTLAMLNWRRTKSGMQPLTMADLLSNPQQAFQSFSGPMGSVPPQTTLPSNGASQTQAPSIQVHPMQGSAAGQPQSLPAGGMLQTGSNYQTPQQQPMSAPQTPAYAPPQAAQAPTTSGLLTPDVQAQIQEDSLYNPEYAKMELQLVQAGMPYIQAKAQTEQFIKDYRTKDAQGNIVNMPGAVQAGAQVAGANSYATSQGSLPATMAAQAQRGAIERQNDVNKAGITPYVQTVQTGPAQFQQLNTNQLAAARSAAPGEMKYTPEQTGNQQKLTDYKAALTDASNEAQGQNIQLNQMLDTMKGFNPSRVADYTASLQGWMNGLGVASDEQTKALSNYQEFSKLATKLSTSQARQLGAREAASVIQMVVRNNPNATMTPQAITDMLNAMKASNDYSVAKNQAGDQYYQQFGTMNGFDAAYQKQHPPVEALAPYLRPEQLQGELGKAALPYITNEQLIQLQQLRQLRQGTP